MWGGRSFYFLLVYKSIEHRARSISGSERGPRAVAQEGETANMTRAHCGGAAELSLITQTGGVAPVWHDRLWWCGRFLTLPEVRPALMLD
jgi:hypothetical protein